MDYILSMTEVTWGAMPCEEFICTECFLREHHVSFFRHIHFGTCRRMGPRWRSACGWLPGNPLQEAPDQCIEVALAEQGRGDAGLGNFQQTVVARLGDRVGDARDGQVCALCEQ